MKLNPVLREQIQKIINLGTVLDLGFGYPYELIELLHLYSARRSIGVDIKKIEDAVSCSAVTQEIATITKIDVRKIENLISDENSEREFHNSYKLYTTLVLEKEPLDFSFYRKSLELHFNKSIQEFLNNEDKYLQNYDVIIASKVLSHINPELEENGDWVLDRLMNKLSSRGIIYLKLNSSDFPIGENNDISDSSILEPFTDERLKKVLNKIDVIEMKTLLNSDGRREHEIIGRKK